MQEESYPGNLGFVEMFRFMQQASKSEVERMEKLLQAKKYAQVWAMLKKVTGSHLQGTMRDEQ
jgi:hypothetical protein